MFIECAFPCAGHSILGGRYSNKGNSMIIALKLTEYIISFPKEKLLKAKEMISMASESDCKIMLMCLLVLTGFTFMVA